MSKNLNLYKEKQSVGFWVHGNLIKGTILTVIEKDEDWKYVIEASHGFKQDYIVEERHMMPIQKAIDYYKAEIKKAEMYIIDLKRKISPFIPQ